MYVVNSVDRKTHEILNRVPTQGAFAESYNRFYLMLNEGWTASARDDPNKPWDTTEYIRLGELNTAKLYKKKTK